LQTWAVVDKVNWSKKIKDVEDDDTMPFHAVGGFSNHGQVPGFTFNLHLQFFPSKKSEKALGFDVALHVKVPERENDMALPATVKKTWYLQGMQRF